MKVFLIIVGILAVITAIILSLSATLTVIYDNKWITKVNVLWFEFDIHLTKILNFILFPKENAEMVKEQKKVAEVNKKVEKVNLKAEEINQEAQQVVKTQQEAVAAATLEVKEETVTITSAEELEEVAANKPSQHAEPPKAETKAKPEGKPKAAKPNFLLKLWNEEGLVGILTLLVNVLETADSAIRTFFRGFHIYSFYVKIIIGGGDAADVAQAYGRVCKYYYPFKGIILNGMRVDNYDDLIMPDYLANGNEYGFQFIGSISVGLLLKVLLSAGKTFLINLIKK